MPRRRQRPTRLCATCRWQPARHDGPECTTCTRYRTRTGRPRPPETIHRHALRALGPAA